MPVCVIDTPAALFAATERERMSARRVGLVPTMGALHAGHMTLVDAVRAAGAKHVVLSIFVNPLQFGQNEDLSRYPRTFEADLALCERGGVDIVYAPTADAMYPQGFESRVEVERLSQPFEGSARPTHFRGVTTVVLKLFNATGPCVAAFGQKDFQQLRVVQRMVQDLDVPVEVLACPIAREPDGLAMSSRNRYLSAQQRSDASAIHRGLAAASRAFAAGERSAARLLALVRAPIAAVSDCIDYVALVDPHELTTYADIAAEQCVVLIAARLGTTRLIDNCWLGRDCL